MTIVSRVPDTAMTLERPKLEIDSVGKIFPAGDGGFKALEDVSIAVAENELISIVGGSGCGKSTLLKIAGGLIKPTSGDVRVDGRVIKGPGADLGMVFQAYSLYPWLNVFENVAFGLRLRNASNAAVKERVEHFLEIVSLADRAGAFPNELSGGMKQRVAIARALANEPAVILLDEPFGALDAQTRGKMQEFLQEIRGRTQVTMMLVTHDIEEALLLGDRVYLMKGPPGHVILELPVDLPKPRTSEIKFGKPFNDLRKLIFNGLAE